jgi:hypothetical protein
VTWKIGVVGAVAVAALFSAPAQAKPIAGVIRDLPSHATVRHSPRAHAANLPYGGGPVLHSNRTHVIFWEPSGSGLTFEPGYGSLIEGFLVNVAADSRRPTNVYGLSGQYGDGSGAAAYDSRYAGAVVASDPLPASGCVEPPVTGPGWTVCLTDSQLQAEIEHVVRADHLPTSPADVYFLVTPKGLGSCTDARSTSCALGGSVTGYCGYHSQSSDGQIVYAVIPYNAVSGHCQSDNPRPNGSTADPTISTISHEHSETITDPAGDAWIDGSGNENGDLCITSFGPAIGGSGATAWNEEIHGGHYFLQEEWSNENGSCQPRDEWDTVSFSAPARAAQGKRVTFTAHARDPDGWIVSYAWFLGDGRTAAGRSVRHAFVRAGVYKVVLRTTDRAGNWAYYARAMSVLGSGAVRAARAAKSG